MLACPPRRAVSARGARLAPPPGPTPRSFTSRRGLQSGPQAAPPPLHHAARTPLSAPSSPAAPPPFTRERHSREDAALNAALCGCASVSQLLALLPGAPSWSDTNVATAFHRLARLRGAERRCVAVPNSDTFSRYAPFLCLPVFP